MTAPTPPRPVRGRFATYVAVGVLILDGVLLGLAGLWGGRGGLVVAGVVCLALAGLVVKAWQRHQARLRELAAVRRDVADEARALRELVRRRPGS